ncbi:MAG: LpqB family beta-propeller domain-containing protein [Chloroflexota bacterium]
MSTNTDPTPRRASRYGAIALNLFTICCLISTAWMGGYFILLLLNPYSALNPFQPLRLPPIAVIATFTSTSQIPTFPPTFTAEPTLTPPSGGEVPTQIQPPTATSQQIVAPSDTPTGPTVAPPTRIGGGPSPTTDGAAITNTPVSITTSAVGHLVFASTRNGDADIFIIDSDGNNEQLLIGEPDVNDENPAMSADGRKFAFQSDRDDDYEIFTANIDGTGVAQLTSNTRVDANPVWSPDGTKIAFESDRNGNFDIWTMNADGTGLTQMTFSVREDRAPAWSPDGTTLAFHSNRDANYEIYTVAVASKTETRLTSGTANNQNPAWSPDSQQIAYDSDQDGNKELYVIDAGGTSEVRMTNDPSSDTSPSWSPDGAQLAFETTRNGNIDIFTMEAFAGAQVVSILTDPADDKMPWWGR